MAKQMKPRGRRFAEGGDVDQEAADKAAGLAESNKEAPVGFFERMRMGNIDDPSSEAYKRFGAGRGASSRAAKVPVEDAVPKKVSQVKVEAESMRGGPEDERPAPTGMGAATKLAPKPVAETKITAVTSKPASAAPAKAPAPAPAPAAQSQAPAAKAPAAKAPAAKAEPVFSGRSSGKGGPTADELEKYAKSRRMDKAFEPPTAAQIDAGMEAAAMMLPSGIGLRAIKALATKLANMPRYKRTPEAMKQIGMDPLKLGNEPLKLGMKKGGAVKTPVKAYASGGSVSASRRGDGIATKGKTRGKMC